MASVLSSGLFALAASGAVLLAQVASPAPAAAQAPKKGFIGDIEKLTTSNRDFRRVLYTGKNLQLVLMTLKPGEEIGEETHEGIDQFFRIESGDGEVRIDGKATKVGDDDAFIVPAGARHNVVNTGSKELKLYTIYGPPEHADKLVHATRKDAETAGRHFDGKTTE